jgi:hypothetical protein
MLPSLTLMLTVTFALQGNSHSDAPSYTPPLNPVEPKPIDAFDSAVNVVVLEALQMTLTTASACHGISQTDDPSKTHPLNFDCCAERADNALGHAYATMVPLFVSTRTSVSALNGAIHSAAPSNAPPENAVLLMYVTPAGHPLYAVMAPVVMLTRTTASALQATNQMHSPSKAPLLNAPLPMLETPWGQLSYAVIVTSATMGSARITPENPKPFWL